MNLLSRLSHPNPSRSHPPATIFSSKSAFSPLLPPSFDSPPNDRYNNYLQSQLHSTKRFLAAPYSGTGYLSTVLQSEGKRTAESDKSEDENVDLQ